ncbi:hypothetical protein ABZ484_24775 [Streptomyces sp. NPDC006393]|uniref:hypothetical protein n=1 Tax=Streptomyces sp. NPDC006393 TaxID=3156763 RepID=UPI0033DDE402
MVPGGLYLLELKGHPGRVVNHGDTWQFHADRVRTLKNPRHLTDLKCKELKGQLERGPRESHRSPPDSVHQARRLPPRSRARHQTGRIPAPQRVRPQRRRQRPRPYLGRPARQAARARVLADRAAHRARTGSPAPVPSRGSTTPRGPGRIR